MAASYQAPAAKVVHSVKPMASVQAEALIGVEA
jgi:hypothetical protein